MSVTSETLEHPERDLDLVNRDMKGKPRTKPGAAPADDELQALRQRIGSAKATVGQDPKSHCRDCFQRGWLAAVREIAGE